MPLFSDCILSTLQFPQPSNLLQRITLQCSAGVEEGIWHVNCFFQKTFIYAICFSPHFHFYFHGYLALSTPKPFEDSVVQLGFLYNSCFTPCPPTPPTYLISFLVFKSDMWADLIFSVFSLFSLFLQVCAVLKINVIFERGHSMKGIEFKMYILLYLITFIFG